MILKRVQKTKELVRLVDLWAASSFGVSVFFFFKTRSMIYTVVMMKTNAITSAMYIKTVEVLLFSYALVKSDCRLVNLLIKSIDQHLQVSIIQLELGNSILHRVCLVKQILLFILQRKYLRLE